MSTKLEYTNLLLWNKWDMTHVKVEDQGLSSVIDLRPMLIPHSGGRHEHQKFSKTKVNVVERLVNQLMHFGKKHAKNTGRMGGKKQKSMSIVRTAFEIIAITRFRRLWETPSRGPTLCDRSNARPCRRLRRRPSPPSHAS